MSVSSPARPRTASPASVAARPIVETQPIRYPNSSSREFMGRRAWWLVMMNVLVPGSAQVLAGNRRLGRFGLGATLTLWVLVILGALAWFVWPQIVYTIGTNWFTLTLAQLLLGAYAVLWIILTFDMLRLVKFVRLKPLARIGVPLVTAALLVLTSGTSLYAANLVGVYRDAVSTIFGAGGPTVAPSDGYYNILLLGADPDQGRDSMRPDSISVVSVNATTGAVIITGIPRDMVNVPFAEGPMTDLFPDGYGGQNCGTAHCALNEIFTEVNILRDGPSIYPDAEGQGSTPGIEAMKDAASGVLGIDIPYYVFIDMHGFAALIDALGGVDITVEQRLPMGGGPSYDGQPVEEWAAGWIEAGPQHMSGDTAQWYARSRYTTSDWDRMKRQRQLQEAMLAQFTPANVLTRFEEVAKAGTHVVQTDLPQSMLPFFVDLALKAKDEPVTTIELTPEGGVEPENPDFAYIRQIVHDAMHPPTPTPSP
jgi:polyisoprenyl-teichoic acid--peptidoglycan teichoic acid transferase